MAVTVEEIEIIVRAKVEEALEGLLKVKAELRNVGATSFSKISSQAKAIAPAVSKASEAVKRSNKDIQSAAKAAADQYGDLDGIIKRVQERAQKAAAQAEADRAAMQQRSTSSPQGRGVLTSTKDLNAFMQDKMSYEGLMYSLQGQNSGANTAAQIKNMSRLDQAAKQASSVLQKLGPIGQAAARKIAAATGQASSETQKYEKQVRKTTGTAKKAFGDLGHHIKRALMMIVVWGGLHAITSTIKDGIQSAIAAPETENLFRVALGKMADDAEGFAVKLKDNLGLDEYITKDMLGTFQQIGTAVGVGQNTAYGMSKSMTMLANDMASLYNVDPQQAFKNLQSALTGQGRAVRKYGFVITEQTIKEAAWRNGLVKNGQELTEQQKYVARGIALMEQSKNAQGDMSRTLGNVQNQLRILKQNLVAAKRSLGQAFIPVIQAALPWLNAFAVLIQRAGTALAKWTYSKFGMDYDAEIAKQKQVISGYNGIAAAEDDIGTEAEKAGKKAQKSLLPIDQINRLQAPNESSSKSSSGSGAGYDPGWGYEPDTGALANFGVMADELKKKLEKVLSVVAAIGAAFAAWKIEKAIFRGLESILGVKGLSGIAKALGVSSGAIAAVAATVLVCVARFAELCVKSEKFRLGLKTIWDGFLNGAKAALGWIKEKFTGLYNYIFPEEVRNKISSALKALDIDFGDVAITAAGVVAMFVPGGQVVGGILLGFEAITLAIRGIGYAASDAVQPVDLFQDGISNATKTKVEPFVKQLRSLDDAVKTIDWGNKVVTQEDVDSIGQKVKAIRETIVKELDADHNEALANLKPLKDNLGNEEYQKILASTDKYYEQQKQKTQNAENRINEIYKNAAAQHRTTTEAENKEIAQLQEQMQTTGIEALSETQVEAQAIMNRMKENTTRVSLEQASEIIKNAQKTRDDAVQAAEEQYVKVVDQANRMREAGTITEDQYNKMISAAKENKDSQIKEADEAYTGVYNSVTENLGETSKYIDTETGNIKSNWQVFKEDISKKASEAWESVKTSAVTKFAETKETIFSWWEDVKKWFNDNIAPKFTKEYWKEKFNTLLDSAKETLNDLKKRFEDWKAKIKTPHMYWDDKDGYKASGLIKTALEALNLPTVIPKLKVKWMAMGGVLNRAQFIGAGEAGSEAIVPLERNLGWLKKLAEQIVDEMDSYAAIPTVTTDQFVLPRSKFPYAPQILMNDGTSRATQNASEANFRKLYVILDRILTAIKQQDFNVQIGDDDIYKSAVRGGKRETMATGRPAFGI